jgi:hypothetical protein
MVCGQRKELGRGLAMAVDPSVDRVVSDLFLIGSILCLFGGDSLKAFKA